MQKLFERFNAWRRRREMARLIDDRTYCLAELCETRRKVDSIDARMNALIALEKGEEPAPVQLWDYRADYS